ncbi:alpha-ketoacid dehydrogenase subunit beta [Aerococcus urinae]|uniref:alpha-ketoacid dehydrogenase subunit beta n=1 Tax=Aerococcus urinae TaxID=1376 RepID=UPI000DCC0E28|nr:alpha-ketoacid dehydrogenase subunit beta [Aerococcus urinae]RAV65688.1 alpha-ketoacid dehydrogenase subunit beta [Aerococcus urinae]
MTEITYLEALNQGIDEEMARDDKVLIFGEDVGGEKGGVFGVSKGLAAKYGDDRVFSSPLTEIAIAGLTVGLGVKGYRAIGEFQFADYILPAVNQINSEAARMRYRTKGDWTAPIVFRAPYGAGVRGGFYHSQTTDKVFAGQPGLRIVTPSTVYDTKGMIKAAIRSDDPVLFYEHKRLYRLLKDEIPSEDYTVPLDKANVLRQGDDITVIAYGIVLQYALKAAERLSEEEGIETEVVDVRSLYPLDKETLVEAAKKTGKVLLVTEDNKEGAIMSEIAAIIAEEALFDLDAPIRRLAGPDVPTVGYALNLEREFLVDEDKVYQAMKELAEF